MANDGIIDSLFDKQKIGEEIKSVVEGIVGAQNSIKSLSETATTVANDMISSFKKMKEAVNLTELNNSIREYSAAQKEYGETLKKRQTEEQKIIALQKQLDEYNRNAAVEIQKLRLEIAEKNREAKNEAQALVASKKAMEDWGRLLTQQSGSIRELTAMNKELRAVRDSLNTDTDKQKIAQLNKIIDGNTAAIKLNQDSYVKQKMDIGDYKIALEGVREQILLASKAIQEMAAKGDTQSKEYLDLMKNLEHLNRLQGDYTEQITEGVKAVDQLKSKMTVLKKEMTELILVGKNNWSEEQKQRYAELSEQAVELQRSLNAANAQVTELATNNLGLRGMADSLSVVTAGTQLYETILSDLGVESKSYQEILVNLQSAQATINSLETLSNKLKTNSVMMIGLQRIAEKGNTAQKWLAVQAQKALNAAQTAMPYIAIAVGMAYLAKAIFDYAVSTSQAIKDQKMFNDIQKASVDLYGKQAAQINVLSKQVERGNLSIKKQDEIISALNKVVAETGKHFKTWEEAEQFLIKDKDKYIQAMAERAYQQQLINEYTNTYIERQKQLEAGPELSFWSALVATIKSGGNAFHASVGMLNDYNNGLADFETKLKKLLEKITDVSSLGDDSAKLAGDLVKSLTIWNHTEIQNLTIKYNDEKALLEKHGEDTALLTKKYYADVAKITQKAAEEQKKTVEYIIQLRIDAMDEGKAKELAALQNAEKKETAAVVGNAEQRAEQVALIDEIYRKKREEVDRKYREEEAKAAAEGWQLKIDIAEKGSLEELDARTELLNNRREQDIANATETGLDVADINKFYDGEVLKAFADFVDAKVAKAQEEVAERGRVAQEAMMAEEAALLARYRSGEINEEGYQKELSAIRHKYSVQAAKDEIASLETLLETENFTEEQKAALRQKITDAKKALSDEETGHELKNIQEVNEARKKAAQMAVDLAKQGFEMAMSYLEQQSEAKVEEFDAEMERVNERMEKELEALDNAVMSDETRAAEEKRIRDAAKAETDKLEAEKRKEQEKAFLYQKMSNIAQTAMNTGTAIMSIWAQVPKFDFGVSATALTIATAALGAAQIAMIAAQQAPKYRYGTDYHEGGYAVVGDAGKREYALTPAGRLFETPAVPTLVNMAEGTRVFPDYLSMSRYFRPEIPKYEGAPAAGAGYELESVKRAIVGAIRENKAVQMVNLDSNGIWHISKNGAAKYRYVNSKIRGNN